MSETSNGGFKVTADKLVNQLMDMYSGNDSPTPQQVEETVDGLLCVPLYASLKGQRDQIVTQFMDRVNVRMGDATILEDLDDHEPWLTECDRDDWKLWQRLAEYLKKEEGYPERVVGEVDRSTDATLSRLESPRRAGRWDRRGMVVGHVQSGKTTHYTALAAKALDAGYRIVIVMAGMHNNLRSQTHGRIDRDLIGRESRLIKEGRQPPPYDVHDFAHRLQMQEPPFQIMTCTTSDDNGDFEKKSASKVYFKVSEHSRLVMVVKKNATVLRKLHDWLGSVMTHATDREGSRIPHPVLFIDDEADQASMNTQKDENDPSSINRLIRQLLTAFDRVGFVAYTATPFANVFADPDVNVSEHQYGPDLFPSSFIVNLKPPSNYIGPTEVFGHSGDESIGLPPQKPLPMHVEVADADNWVPPKHKKDHEPGPLPETLVEALRLFALVCTARSCRGDDKVHNSMLIHATRFVNVQGRVYSQVRTQMEAFASLLEHGGPDTRAEQIESFQEIWQREIVEKHPAFREVLKESVSDLPGFEEVLERLPSALRKIQVLQLNGESQDVLGYDNHEKEGFWVVAIGGDKLSRGLTLEGLSVSYFLRTSRAFDTLTQMGRWFGYRPRYADLCRIYTAKELVGAFREIALATEELRSDLDRMALTGQEPRDFGLRVRTPSDGLLITAANKIRRGLPIQVRYAGELVQALQMPAEGESAAENRRALTDLIAGLGKPSRDVRGKPSSYFIWKNVEVKSVLSFLSRFEATRSHSFIKHSERLQQYIRERNDRADELVHWTICLMSNSKTASKGQVNIAGLPVELKMRSPVDDCPPDQYHTNAVAGLAEETVDLTESEYQHALDMDGSKSNPNRRFTRKARPAERGLLLLYPIYNPSKEPKDYVVSAAISFPTSDNAKPLTYTVNTVYQQQAFSFLEDPEDEAGVV